MTEFNPAPALLRRLACVIATGAVLALAGAAAAAAAEPGGMSKSPFARPGEREKLYRELEALTGKPLRKPGAHRPSDPHAALGPERMIQVALRHQAEGRPGHAIDTLSDALVRFPGDAGLLSVRGSLLLQQDKAADALRDLEAAVRAEPDNPAIYVNRAQAYRRFGNKQKALEDLDRAVELDPDFVAARFNRGTMHFNASRFGAALADFERCVAVDPHAPPPWFNLAMTRDRLGDKAGAVADLNRFLELAKEKTWREVAEKKLAELSGAGKAAGAPAAPAAPAAKN